MTVAILGVVQSPIETVATSAFKRILPTRKFPLNSDLRQSKAQLLGERVFKVTMSSLLTGLLFVILAGEDCDFFDVRLGGKTERPLYFFNHPCQKLPARLDDFYVFKLGYHCYELLHTIAQDRRRSDYLEYLLHHFLTFSLILFSYKLNYLPVGAAVMILHDVTDLCVSIFKLMIDVTPMFMQMTSYVLMFVTWVYFRLWFFPSHVILRIVEESSPWQGRLPFDLNSVLMLSFFLTLLLGMHIFWFYLMIKGIMKRFSKSTAKDQVILQSNVNRVD